MTILSGLLRAINFENWVLHTPKKKRCVSDAVLQGEKSKAMKVTYKNFKLITDIFAVKCNLN